MRWDLLFWFIAGFTVVSFIRYKIKKHSLEYDEKMVERMKRHYGDNE